eukprot:scaffold22520_cov47-Prasinocladus_malaysianus.AAC.1
MEQVEAIVMREPPPVAVAGLKKLRESVQSARLVLPRLQALAEQMKDTSSGSGPPLADVEL